jgi:hypothetical protein
LQVAVVYFLCPVTLWHRAGIRSQSADFGRADVRAGEVDAKKIWPFVGLVILAAGFTVTIVYVVVWATRRLNFQGRGRPEIILPLLLVCALIALVIALAILVGAFYLFGLTARQKPFGVPEGTLQAVIALALIMIFAVTSLYLRGSLKPGVVTVPGLTAAQVDKIPGDQIVGKAPSARAGRFDVTRRVPLDQDEKNFSNQLLTILGTLVGAVAGFYFGAKSVETGVSAGGGTSTVKPTNTSPPVISGAPAVGETLRTEVGGWTGSPPPNYGHQWQRKGVGEAEWREIPGATLPTYLLSPEDAGTTIRVAVTATNSAGAELAFSASTDEIRQAPTLKSGSSPKITGEAKEGNELSADPGEWAGWPRDLFTYTYRWERASPNQSDWSTISAAAQSSKYVLVRDDVGKVLRVEVAARNAAGPASEVSVPTAAVVGSPKNTRPPSIEGEIKAGQELLADPGEWTGWPPPTLSFQWQRQVDGAWQDIGGATAASYEIARDDVGKALQVVVTATNAVDPASSASAVTEVVQGPPMDMVPPSVEGEPKEEQTLRANPGEWSGWPTPSSSYSFQWQRQVEGAWQDIGGATAASYALARDDVGKALRVVVTATNAVGSASSESAPTEVVQGAPINAVPPSIDGEPRERETLRANPGEWTGWPSPSSPYSFQWQRQVEDAWQDITGSTTASYESARDDVGKALQVVVTATNAVGSASSASTPTEAVQGPPINAVPPSIDGEPREGETLRANPGEWTGWPPPTYTFEWQRQVEGAWEAIPGAISDSYEIPATDVGTLLRVVVNATNEAGAEEKVSEATPPIAPAGSS